MKNMQMRVEGTKLIIEVDTTKELGESGSGKSILVATTGSPQDVPDTDLKIGLNIYKPVKNG